jgi:hypothetical protein
MKNLKLVKSEASGKKSSFKVGNFEIGKDFIIVGVP